MSLTRQTPLVPYTTYSFLLYIKNPSLSVCDINHYNIIISHFLKNGRDAGRKFIKNSFLPAVLLVMRLYDGFVIVISAGIVGAFENAGRITVRKHFFNGDCGQ